MEVNLMLCVYYTETKEKRPVYAKRTKERSLSNLEQQYLDALKDSRFDIDLIAKKLNVSRGTVLRLARDVKMHVSDR